MNGSDSERLAARLDQLADAARPDRSAPLRAPERAALAALARHGALPLKEIALAAGIAKSTASGLVDALVLQGLVHRERDGADGRRLALRLTPAGEAALASAPLLDQARLAAAVAALSPGDQAELERLLGLVADGVSALAGAPGARAQQVPSPAPAPHRAAVAAPVPAPPQAAAVTPVPATVPPAAAGGPLRVVVCIVGGAAYALPLAQVVEVLPYAVPRSLGAPSDRRAGVIATRDGHLPVCVLAQRLGVAGPPPTSIVVVDGPAGREGLAVDRVAGLSTAAAGSIAPPVGGGVGVCGIVELDGSLVVLLDVDALLGG